MHKIQEMTDSHLAILVFNVYPFIYLFHSLSLTIYLTITTHYCFVRIGYLSIYLLIIVYLTIYLSLFDEYCASNYLSLLSISLYDFCMIIVVCIYAGHPTVLIYEICQSSLDITKKQNVQES